MYQEKLQTIMKEDINSFHFSKNDVLNSELAISKRKSDLYKAMILGNSAHGKVKIVFETESGTTIVETTVWCATETDVNLKGGINIPVRSIREVIL